MNKSDTKNNLFNQSKNDFRRFADQIISLAVKGRMTLELLRDISFGLLNFTKCSVVEIAYVEREKIFHCDTRRDESPDFFCDTIKTVSSIEKSLESILKLPVDLFKLEGLFSDTCIPRLAQFIGEKDESDCQILQLAIPIDNRVSGVVLLAFSGKQQLTACDAEPLEDLCRAMGLALTHNQSQFELHERVKELTCMYNIANLDSQSTQKTGKLLDNIVTLLPPAWLYPKITEACITLDGERHYTAGYKQTKFNQSANILVDNVVCGKVEVVYLESRPELDEGSFLTEERHLIDSVARELGLIIKRRQAENEQARLHEQLKHADRLATIGQLAAGVAHELNEPLTGILGFAELLKDMEEMPEQALKDIERIESASLYAREIVRKLLLFARQVPTKSHEVDVNNVIKEVISFFERRLAKDSIIIKTELAAKLPVITADQSQIRQVIVNLFVNSSHAMPKGGILTVTTYKNEKTIYIKITDTGEGMSDEVQEKVFLPFFTTKDVNQGTGLGLSVVHGIIKAHHGQIDVQSDLGKGTTFTIHMPIGQANDE